MDLEQLNVIKNDIQSEFDRLEELERKSAEDRDYANAIACFNHRLGLLKAFSIVLKSNFNQPTNNASMTRLWLARWKNNSLHLYYNKPTRDEFGEFWSFDGNLNDNSMPLVVDSFPEVTYENSPVEVTLTVQL